MTIKLNCDLGESFGAWTMGLDSHVMPHIDMANIACGFHAGDPITIQHTLALAKKYNVTVGAHPSYPDLAGFGRRSMNIDHDELINLLHYQISALDGMAKINDLSLDYVKPHGALYNDMMKDEKVRAAVIEAMHRYHRPLTLVIQATEHTEQHVKQANKYGVKILTEAFADRAYNDDGTLVSRSLPNAVLNQSQMLNQIAQLIEHGTITSVSGKILSLKPDTVCVHGDNQAGVVAIEQIRQLITNAVN